MKYYKLKNSRNRKEIGVSPQSEEVKDIGDLQKDFVPWEGRIDFELKLPEPILEKKAKQTSFVNVVAIPSLFLVIDNSLLELLKKHNIGNYQSWKIKTWQSKKLVEKYHLFIINDTKQAEYINYEKSEFYSKKLGDWNNSSIQKPVFVKNYDEYSRVKENLRKDKLMLLHKKVTINLNKINVDMFRIVNAPPGGYFISENLKNAIEQNGFTGMDFEELEKIKSVEVIY